MRLYDITHPLGPQTAPWPGDPTFRLEWTAAMAMGSPANVSQITMSPHNGTHADAPYHYDDEGDSMEAAPLELYLGRARLIAVEGKPSVSRAELEALELTGVERLLIRTGSCPDLSRFHHSLSHLEPAAVDYLAALGVRLVGTDAHSVDPVESVELPAHHACRRAGIRILENLNLAEPPLGEYELIALPLRLIGADGSPVRAVLRSLPKA